MSKKLFYNGYIYTMDEEKPQAEAVLVEDGRIAGVGEMKDLEVSLSEGDERIDLEGKMLLPGFIDAHCHPTLSAFFSTGLYISIESSHEEVMDAIRRYISDNPDADSYFGFGYAEWNYDEKGPSKEMLDEICSDKPVFFLGSSGHEGWCNSKALELAGITSETPDPNPGFQYFERDTEGNPTGHVVETRAETMIFSKINFFDDEVIKQNFYEVFDSYSRCGVTSLTDCGSFEWMEDKALAIYEDIYSNGSPKQRLAGCAFVDNKDRVEPAFQQLETQSKVHDDDMFRINTYKIILDGTMETRSASNMEPYDEDGSVVAPLLEGEELKQVFLRAAERGHDIHVHAIGDRAVHEVIRGAKAVRNAGYKDIRITNAHTDYVNRDDRSELGKYDVIVNTTGVWHYGNPIMEKIIGKRADEQFTIKTLLDNGAVLSLGSDRPVDEFGYEPLKSIQMAATRQMFDDITAPVLEPASEKLDLHRCLEGYTTGAAYQLHMEDRLGKIKEGYYADLVVLGDNIFEHDINDIWQIPVCATYSNGERTF